MEAQDTLQHKYAVAVSFHHGFIIAHRPVIVPLQQNHVDGLEVNATLHTNGKNPWQQVFGYPDIGLSFSAWNLGNKNQFGDAFILLPYLDIHLAGKTNCIFNLKFGAGVGYIEKVFNPDDNYKNIAIGSHFNAAISLQPKLKIRLSDRFNIQTGLAITHFSNGSIVTPNLGINIASVHAGFTYAIGKSETKITNDFSQFNKFSRLTFFTSGSIKQVYPADGKNYFASTLLVDYTLQNNRKRAFGAGLDIFYDASIKQKLEERSLPTNHPLERIKTGIHGSYELTLDNFSILFNMGVYIYTKLYGDGIIYHRVGVKYHFTKNMFVGLNLKTHFAKADFAELGFGYTIFKNRK